MTAIRYNGLDHLTDEEQYVLKKLVEKEFPKIERMMKNVDSVVVDVKTHDKGGKRKMYMLDVKVIAPKTVFSVKAKENTIKKSPYWDLAASAHHAMESLEAEVKHKLKADTVAWKKTDMKRGMRSKLNE